MAAPLDPMMPSGRFGTTVFDPSADPATAPKDGASLHLTIIEGNRVLEEVDLAGFGSREISFGAAEDNDIVIKSSYGIVSGHHGVFVLYGSMCQIMDSGSTNGVYVNGERRMQSSFSPGDVVSIGKPAASRYDAIMMLLSYTQSSWRVTDLSNRVSLTVGRAPDNDLELGIPSVSSHHALFTRDQQTGRWLVTDRQSFNGVFVSGSPVVATSSLTKGDIITIAGATLVFTGEALIVSSSSQGVDVLARDLVQVRKVKGGKRTTTDHVSLHIHRGEFVAILGGSGAGKSTLLDELNGTDPAVSGSVLVDGSDLYANYGALKNTIGYVPQKDIVYDDLRLIDMLIYAAELRMPPDTSRTEYEARALAVLDQLELMPFKDHFIRQLSGGQRKRASIAVEMLADPRLFFLDEPTSGLDPGIERHLMEKLASLAHGGRTVIVVTHTTLNVSLCDRIVFMGAGGLLCFEGAPADALAFFGVDDFVEIYDLVNANPAEWARRFATYRSSTSLGTPPAPRQAEVQKKRSPSLFKQVGTLSRRYAKLIANNRARLILLLGQAPLLGALICMVAGDGTFEVYEPTKSCLFSLACAAFWIGILNSIQEVCKERTILKREYAGGVKLLAYLESKVIVLGLFCVLQAALLAGTFMLIKGVPKYELLNPAFEIFNTCLLVMLSAMSMGLMVSALFKSPDSAIAVAPILIMPQILFSGLVFELEGVMKTVSTVVNCRWGMEAFGTAARLNKLDLKIYQDNDKITPEVYKHEWEAAYDFTLSHLMSTWGILLAFCVVCIVACGVILRMRIRK